MWMRSERGKTYISSGILLPSKVTHLVIKKPSHFCFRPGDYVFVNIPAIAKYEWHPFTLSSAPEEDDYIWLHIRGVGEWTNRLREYFEVEHKRLHNGEVPPLISNGGGGGGTGNGTKEMINAVEMFNEQVNISGNSNGPAKLTESKVSPLVTHSNGKTMVDPIRKIQA